MTFRALYVILPRAPKTSGPAQILLASSVPCIALSHLESWCKLRRCIQTLGMIHFVIISLIISFLKTETIPTYQGISIAFLRYNAIQHPSSHDLFFIVIHAFS